MHAASAHKAWIVNRPENADGAEAKEFMGFVKKRTNSILNFLLDEKSHPMPAVAAEM